MLSNLQLYFQSCLGPINTPTRVWHVDFCLLQPFSRPHCTENRILIITSRPQSNQRTLFADFNEQAPVHVSTTNPTAPCQQLFRLIIHGLHAARFPLVKWRLNASYLRQDHLLEHFRLVAITSNITAKVAPNNIPKSEATRTTFFQTQAICKRRTPHSTTKHGRFHPGLKLTTHRCQHHHNISSKHF